MACRAPELVKALADELVRLRHEVTVFGGSDFGGTDETACWERRDLDRIFDAAREFDLVHYGALEEALKGEEVALLIADSGEAIDAVEWAQAVSRGHCRALIERRFTAARMAEDYDEVYRALARRH